MVDLRCLHYILNSTYLCFALLMSGWLKVENSFHNFNFESLTSKVPFWLRLLANRNPRLSIAIESVVNMSGFGIAHLNIFLCLLGFTMALDDSQAFHIRMQRDSSLDNDQILGSSKSSQASDLEKQPKIDDHRKQHFKNPRKVRNNKRCFQGCPFGLEDTLLDCSRPWGWGPGPLYPEYGPHFHRGWAGHGSPFGCNNCGFGGPWRVPGCSCGCNNYGWRCKSIQRSFLLFKPSIYFHSLR